ncbi:MAG: ABC transporter substrate-binding protein, partial [Candidatus Acetothermia bacterium]
MFNLSAGRKSFVGILLILSMLFSVGATVLAQEDLIVAKNEPTPTADPHDSHHTFTGPIVNLIFDRLITVDEDGNYAPELATDWEFSEDQTELRLTLREGVEFHDGSPFNAEAVKYNFERILDPDNALSARDRLTAIQDVEVLDEYQVQLNFDEPYGPLLNILSSFQVSMVSPEAAREYGVEEFDQNLVGTGPYEMKEWVRGERFVVERAGDYWGPEPQFDEVEFRPILEDSARVAALMTGE